MKIHENSVLILYAGEHDETNALLLIRQAAATFMQLIGRRYTVTGNKPQVHCHWIISRRYTVTG